MKLVAIHQIQLDPESDPVMPGDEFDAKADVAESLVEAGAAAEVSSGKKSNRKPRKSAKAEKPAPAESSDNDEPSADAEGEAGDDLSGM